MARSTLRENEVRTLARIEGVPEELALAVWDQETSRGQNVKTSGKGARGDFQVMPATFNAFVPGGNINDPVDNALAGIRYLKNLLSRYRDPELAAQAYYGGRPVGVGGKRDVDSGPGTPTITEYGRDVLARMQAFMPQREPQTFEGTATPVATPVPDWEAMMPFGVGASLGTFDDSMPNPADSLMAQIGGMYGVDQESGLPSDVAMGLRDEGTPYASNDMDSYLNGLVDKTLRGMSFG